MRVRSSIFVSYLDFLMVFLCLYVGSVVPALYAAQGIITSEESELVKAN